MSNFFIVLLVAISGGVAAVVQAQLNGIMDKAMGTVESVFVTYAVGGIAIALVMIVLRGGNLGVIRTLPWYVIFAGFCGLVIIGSISFTVPRLGLVAAITLLIATQFAVGSLIDHFGLMGAEIRPLTLQRVAGVVILLFAVWLIVR